MNQNASTAIRHLATLVFLSAGVIGCNSNEAPNTVADRTDHTPTASANSKPASIDGDRTPLEVVRSFFSAMMSNDEAGVRKEILPHPDAEVLWQGQLPPPEELAAVKQQVDNMSCRECTVGETIDLPGGQKLEVTNEMVNENNQLLFPIVGGETMPTPLPVVKFDGEWKVNAGSLIAARRTGMPKKEKKSTDE